MKRFGSHILGRANWKRTGCWVPLAVRRVGCLSAEFRGVEALVRECENSPDKRLSIIELLWFDEQVAEWPQACVWTLDKAISPSKRGVLESV
jgi:hypothetical protein